VPAFRRVRLEVPSPQHAQDFLDAVRRSRRLLRPWVYPPSTPEAYDVWLHRLAQPAQEGHLVVRRASRALVGVVNVNEIVRGGFRSAYLGYYAFLPHAGQGYMTEALGLVLRRVFGPLGLHRVEANIQPGNEASRRLVRRLGFRREGFSPCYLRVGGRWRDHERWALIAEAWRAHRAAVR
jgi:ribosomal-protein-alanine N-acetyltransferase